MNINPLVVDLSHYQDVTDWAAVRKAGIRGVINKATEGPGLLDTTFAYRRSRCGMLYGGYHFLRPGDVSVQVKHFLDATAPHEGLLLALDYEDPKVPLANAVDFLTQVHATLGRWPVLYSGNLIKEHLGNLRHPVLAQTKLWLAQYSAIPSWPEATWTLPWLWQFTDGVNGPRPHAISGIAPGGLDIDSYAGTDLVKEWAS